MAIWSRVRARIDLKIALDWFGYGKNVLVQIGFSDFFYFWGLHLVGNGARRTYLIAMVGDTDLLCGKDGVMVTI